MLFVVCESLKRDDEPFEAQLALLLPRTLVGNTDRAFHEVRYKSGRNCLCCRRLITQINEGEGGLVTPGSLSMKLQVETEGHESSPRTFAWPPYELLFVAKCCSAMWPPRYPWSMCSTILRDCWKVCAQSLIS